MTAIRFQIPTLVALRLALGWIFLYAGLSQVFNPEFSAVGLLSNAKTFPDLYAWLATPGVVDVVNFLASWGHVLIGLSIVSGVALRMSIPFAVLLNILYWLPRLDFPYVGHGFIIDSHIVYAIGLIYLLTANAGRYFSLETWLEKRTLVNAWADRHPRLRPWLLA